MANFDKAESTLLIMLRTLAKRKTIIDPIQEKLDKVDIPAVCFRTTDESKTPVIVDLTGESKTFRRFLSIKGDEITPLCKRASNDAIYVGERAVSEYLDCLNLSSERIRAALKGGA